ncbi:MBL fold metallo-hydrolase [Thauera aromatica]|uniref:MBL fold metallo-hydrolase n=1 Tax=Thauera aromatica TaxID=59405 RepID=UPI001FFDC2E3|nr:MBL fold metallo-hydrolase [Thauera aromatica]MCK2095804.1 MBL fold metallo-hydrolase [Thauera aromatica]
MKLPTLLRNLAAVAGVLSLAACTGAPTRNALDTTAAPPTSAVKFQQIRNATIKVDYAGTAFLIDPMLAKRGAYPGFEGTYNSHLRNPLVELPMPVGEVMRADAVILTHLHPDHWDEAAKRSLPKDIPIFTQNEADAQAVRKDGFKDVHVLSENTVFEGTRLSSTSGQHGSDAMMQSPLGEILGTVSGVVFQRPGHKTVYVAGDTVWNNHVEEAIRGYRPDVIVLNAGDARVPGFDGSIIMGKEDVYRAGQFAPHAILIASHMEAVNHGMLTRRELRDYIAEKQINPQRVRVPEDGESYVF